MWFWFVIYLSHCHLDSVSLKTMWCQKSLWLQLINFHLTFPCSVCGSRNLFTPVWTYHFTLCLCSFALEQYLNLVLTYELWLLLIYLVGIFSGKLSLDLAEDSKWNISRGGFCGMRSKKVVHSQRLKEIWSPLLSCMSIPLLQASQTWQNDLI